QRGRHDRRLGASALRSAGADVEPNRQRGGWHQPRCLRHLQQAAQHDRMGIAPASPEAREVEIYSWPMLRAPLARKISRTSAWRDPSFTVTIEAPALNSRS